MKKVLGLILIFVFALSASAQVFSVGAIEIGSRGVKCVGFDINQKEDGDFEVMRKTYSSFNNVSVMSGLQDGNMLSANMSDAATAVAGCKAKLDTLKVSKLVIAASSGVCMAKNKDDLKKIVDTASNSDMIFLTSSEEGFYTLISSVGMSKLTTSVLLDVGSGNARISYLQDKDIDSIRNVDIPYGAITLRDASKKFGGEYVSTVKNIIGTNVLPVIETAKTKSPGISNPFRKVVIVGGSAWAMSSLIAPNQIGKANLKFTYADVKKFVSSLNDKKSIQFPENPPAGSISTLSKVADTMSSDDLIAGTNLMQSMLGSIGVLDKREISFPAESGWTTGYLIYNLNK
jgi:exopolyphosphatase/pppGpp-phosphohydrolase